MTTYMYMYIYVAAWHQKATHTNHMPVFDDHSYSARFAAEPYLTACLAQRLRIGIDAWRGRVGPPCLLRGAEPF